MNNLDYLKLLPINSNVPNVIYCTEVNFNSDNTALVATLAVFETDKTATELYGIYHDIFENMIINGRIPTLIVEFNHFQLLAYVVQNKPGSTGGPVFVTRKPNDNEQPTRFPLNVSVVDGVATITVSIAFGS